MEGVCLSGFKAVHRSVAHQRKGPGREQEGINLWQ